MSKSVVVLGLSLTATDSVTRLSAAGQPATPQAGPESLPPIHAIPLSRQTLMAVGVKPVQDIRGILKPRSHFLVRSHDRTLDFVQMV